MTQAIAGVSPSSVRETEIMTVWPSNGAFPSGRMLGGLYAIEFPNVSRVFRIGNLIALASIPHALFLYFWKVLPYVGIRYTLTNRRVVVERGWMHVEERSVSLGNFDDIRIVVQPGQAWYHAGDLIFLNGQREVFRLSGVSRPKAFRASCIKAQMAYVGVKAALAAAH